MAAIRIARAHTGRDDVLTIRGSYHGHHDVGMVGASGACRTQWRATCTASTSTTPLRWRKIVAHRRRAQAGLRAHGARENERRPRAPEPGYLEAVREITRRHGVVLIFDEVKTGLTIAAGGATERFGVAPDVVTLAKALGAGLPTGRSA